MTHFTAFPRTLCFILNGDDVLLLKGAATKRLYANLYNGVGGHVERHEDVLSSLHREVREETGLTITSPRLGAIIVADEGQANGVVIFVYTAIAPSRGVHASAEGELQWVRRDRLMEYELVPDLRALLPRLFGAPPGHLLYGHYGPNGLEFRS
jgi:8-oxo-dGTP diphosphatase